MLDARALPLALYHKSKELMWDPRTIDFSQDQIHWRERITPAQRDLLLRLSTMFLGGEQAVTHDLAPLLVGVRRLGGRLEEEMFITAQLFEESKHVEFFERWLTELEISAPQIDFGPAYHMLFAERLPSALSALALGDNSPAVHVRALCTYHMIIEGVLAETGYRGYVRMLKQNALMPGTVNGVELVQRDEARHIAFGLYSLDKWFKHDPGLRALADETLSDLLVLVFQIVADAFAPYGEEVPFQLDPVEFVSYASEQFDSRMAVLERGM
jgi:ribonucleoside-diphosphate reductase beta chain